MLTRRFLDETVDMYKHTYDKNTLLPMLLRIIMKCSNISTDQYVITAGYGLRNFKSISDLDVTVSPETFQILLTLPFLEKGKSSLNKIHDRCYIRFPKIDNKAEIEFYAECPEGFPSQRFLISNLKDNYYLDRDFFENQCLNILGTIDLYGNMTIINNSLMMGRTHPVTLKRLNKHLSHLMIIAKSHSLTPYHKYVVSKIRYLEMLKQQYLETNNIINEDILPQKKCLIS